MRNYRHVLGNDELETLKTDSPQNPCSTFSFVHGRMRLSDGGSVAGPHCSAPLASILLSLVSITWTTQKGGCLLSHWTWTSKEPPVALPVSVSPPPGIGLPEEVTELGKAQLRDRFCSSSCLGEHTLRSSYVTLVFISEIFCFAKSPATFKYFKEYICMYTKSF